jgi:magnesium transporter
MVDPIVLDDALEHVHILLEQENIVEVTAYLEDLHPADSAEILTNLSQSDQQGLVDQLPLETLADIFEQLDEDEMVELSQGMEMSILADVLDEMESDMAADFLGELDEARAAELLEEMEESEDVAPLLSYDEDTAGGIMNSLAYALRRQWRVSHALDFLRQQYADDEETLYYIYVVDRFKRLAGVVSLRSLIMAQPDNTIDEIMDRDVLSVRVDTDQEEVAQLLARYDLLALPVVDWEEHLLGVVTVDDVVDVLEEEATEDIYRLAQVSEEAEIFSPIMRAIRNRLPWLVVNMGTAFLASSVVSYYEPTIARAAVLAAFMPIVAGQGGNAGTQTMTIVVRSLALGELDGRDTWKALWHEARVGIINGIVLGLLVGLVAWLWKGIPILGLVIGIAMLGNMLIAALAGVVVPMFLRWIKVDPALASSVFVTTATDVLGFSLFLGLATYFIAWLV